MVEKRRSRSMGKFYLISLCLAMAS